jgi:hypothetical protein
MIENSPRHLGGHVHMTLDHRDTKKEGNGAYHAEQSAIASPLPNFHKDVFCIEDERSRLRYDGWRKVCDWKPVSYGYQKYLDTRVKLKNHCNQL